MSEQKKRGRPKGSKNKATLAKIAERQQKAISKPKTEDDETYDDPHGQLLEKLNRCANCSGNLRASDGHFHTKQSMEYYGAEVRCCSCVGHVS